MYIYRERQRLQSATHHTNRHCKAIDVRTFINDLGLEPKGHTHTNAAWCMQAEDNAKQHVIYMKNEYQWM